MQLCKARCIADSGCSAYTIYEQKGYCKNTLPFGDCDLKKDSKHESVTTWFKLGN